MSTAAAEWLEARTTRAERAQLIARLGQGEPVDTALRAVVGIDTAGLDAALRRELAGGTAPRADASGALRAP